ncbi:MAG: Asp-tRNA(Asn)/Glu-tRNA(Gln) amidotransferase subunit GatB [Oscillospiraceae bacterium]|nr:Asp-tRNA(Asn)/Glu-tRNA(Gln) amidotransferase subunit GatB [Oscillospiraceae bacterium]
MGLEVHAELSTKTKIFCACANKFGGAPNTHVCPVCTAMPGALPVFNRRVLEYAVRLGLALNCDITRCSKFDRKNYFYPDLPAAYQISQLYAPICKNGCMEIALEDGGTKTIGIHQIHMEADAGKLIHDPANEQTYVDYNRSCVPLLEIVSEPDFSSAAQVIAYLTKLRETLLYLGICDCKMQEGSIRADVNLSVRRPGEALGVRAEMKNLNSFKAIARAIEYEAARQIEVLEKGGTLVQETRRWDDNKGRSYPMRSKENANDYRYFPEPDLLPMQIDDQWIEGIRGSLPELAHEKRARYIKDFGLSEFEAGIITAHKNISDLFEEIARQSGQALESARLVTGEIMRMMNNTGILPEDLSLDAGKLAYLVKLVIEGKINRNSYKDALNAVFTRNVQPADYVKEKGYIIVNDTNAVAQAIEAVIAENPNAVTDYKSGIQKAFGFLMGQVMQKLKGAGNPGAVKAALTEVLGS